jgi:proton glutamate symport protein
MRLPKISLTWKIMIGLAVGVFTGWLIRELDSPANNHHVLGIETATLLAFIRSLSTLFLNLIKTIIAPLIFATLVVGIAGTGDIKQVGRIGIKSLFYFEVVTTLALVIGLAAYCAGPWLGAVGGRVGGFFATLVVQARNSIRGLLLTASSE